MITVALDSLDVVKAYEIAKSRWDGKEQFSSTRNYKNFLTSERVHQIGALGEVAVAKYYKWNVDTVPRIKGDNGCDFLYHGNHMDVQTTSYDPPHLKYDSKHPFRADVAILVRMVDERTFEIAGWITKEKFARVHTVKNYGYGKRLTVTPEDMQPPSSLLDSI